MVLHLGRQRINLIKLVSLSVGLSQVMRASKLVRLNQIVCSKQFMRPSEIAVLQSGVNWLNHVKSLSADDWHSEK